MFVVIFTIAQCVWNADYILGMGDSGLGSVFFMHSPPAKQKH